MKAIELEFDGYWCDDALSDVPNQSGIYCVYACVRRNEERMVNIRALLYIGESSHVQRRLQTHDRHDDWVDELKFGETLCYSFAPVTPSDRERTEAALIFKCQPPLNEEHTGHFTYEDTTVITKGENCKLPSVFTIEKDSTR